MDIKKTQHKNIAYGIFGEFRYFHNKWTVDLRYTLPAVVLYVVDYTLLKTCLNNILLEIVNYSRKKFHFVKGNNVAIYKLNIDFDLRLFVVMSDYNKTTYEVDFYNVYMIFKFTLDNVLEGKVNNTITHSKHFKFIENIQMDDIKTFLKGKGFVAID